MNQKKKEKTKCIFYMKSGNKIEGRIEPDAFNDFLTLFKTNKDGFLQIINEMQESILLIKIKEVESLVYWE